jgi:hypothetical protein
MSTTATPPAATSGPIPRIAPAPAARPRPRPEDGPCAGRPLLAVVAGPRDVTGALADAAGRAIAESRPLLLAVVRAPAPLTTNPVVQALAAARRARETDSLARVAQLMCELAGVEVPEPIVVSAPTRLTRRGRRHALDRRLQALARTLGAELHPTGRPAERSHP